MERAHYYYYPGTPTPTLLLYPGIRCVGGVYLLCMHWYIYTFCDNNIIYFILFYLPSDNMQGVIHSK